MRTICVAVNLPIIAVAAVLAVSFPRLVSAEDNSAGPPTVHAGDVWVDRVPSGDKEFKVTSVTLDGFAYTQWGAEMASDNEWNPTITRSLTEANSPPSSYEKPLLLFPFPLTPGKTWNAESKFQIPDISQSGRIEVAGKVGNWEEITVPAGTIRALRVDVTTRAIGRLGLNNTVVIKYWYAPQFSRFVKFHEEDESQGITDAEMVSYKPAKP